MFALSDQGACEDEPLHVADLPLTYPSFILQKGQEGITSP